MPLLAEGQIIRDTYEVERFLGEGAFAEVWRVRHRFLGRQAMKVFKQGGSTRDEIEDLLGEAIMLSRIGHPNIVRVFDANILECDDGAHGYFTMENVPSGSLNDYRRSQGSHTLPVAVTVDIVKQVCRGLAVAHSQTPPVIHRDIKPANILVGHERDGLRARLGDFGLAKRVNPLTLLATTAGTPAFKPPEVFGGGADGAFKSDSAAGDTWALGATLYLLLTDQLPFRPASDTDWYSNAHFKQKRTPAADINPDVSAPLNDIIEKALAFAPNKRFRDAAELLAALEDMPNRERERAAKVRAERERGGRERTTTATSGAVASGGTGGNAQKMLRDAIALKDDGHLQAAADLLEKAIRQFPVLREKHAVRVKLWRNGISM
ncbi:MAG: serine/threonine protein kinase [Puniceicoccales bacterium]|jgi:serine/threonine-protein kinase|nr:serine/threonine protein kinase [Puniceicoccales bacterium]